MFFRFACNLRDTSSFANLLVNTTPFPSFPSELLECSLDSRTLGVAHYTNTPLCYFTGTKHFLTNGLRTQTQTFALHFFLLSPHQLFPQHEHRHILLAGYHSIK